MAGRGINPQFMQELKQKNDIVDVISSYVSLDRKGGNYWACCPFHHEKTPSFAVNQADQYYHCFGCGVSGDVVSFVQEIESTDFMGAVRILADRAKMEVPENNFDSEKIIEMKKKRDNIMQIIHTSARFYLSNLYSGQAEEHLKYISRRNLSPTIIKKFGLGASLNFYDLPDYLSGKGYQKVDLIDSGVLAESHNGKLIDAQGGRLIFPIINALDEVVAFGGRQLEKTDFAKYKNTKETMVFNKSKTLFNINLLKKLKRTKTISNVIMVEGYMDTLSLYQAGFENVVASMGTSLTKDQARLVKRYSDNVLISYDGDFAGQKADMRGLEILKSEQINVKVVPLPEGLDPDDVVKQGKEAYQACLDKAMPLIDYKLHSLELKYDISKSEEKRKFLSEALKVVKSAESEAEKEVLLKRLRDKTGITYQSLERDLDNTAEIVQTRIETPVHTEKGSDKYKKAKRFILSAKLFSMPYAANFSLDNIEFEDDIHRIIADYIIQSENKGTRIRPSDIFDLVDEDCPELNAILDLTLNDQLKGSIAEEYFNDSIRTLEENHLNEQMNKYKLLFEKETDNNKRKEIAIKLNEYTRLLKKNNKNGKNR